MAIEWVEGWQSPRVRALVTQRHGAGVSQPPFDSFNLGDRCGDDPQAVAANRAALQDLAALPSPPRWLRQVHGTHAHRFDAPVGAGVAGDGDEAVAWPSRHTADGFSAACDQDQGTSERSGRRQRRLLQVEADAAVTLQPGVVLAVLTADCLPVVLAARDGSEVAVAHAGWRGLSAGVLEATVAAMRTRAAELQAWLGPAAGPRAYEVGDEVRDAFLAGPAGAAAHGAFVATRPGHWLCDLYALARLRLAAAGVVAVRGGGCCTISEPATWFSHRRDARSGRQATLAWLAPT